jgi:hypothetical protein
MKKLEMMILRSATEVERLTERGDELRKECVGLCD